MHKKVSVVDIKIGDELEYKGVACKCTDLIEGLTVLLEDKYGNEVWVPSFEAEVTN